MNDTPSSIAYVRTEDSPRLPAPASTVGVQGWLRANLFSSPLNSLLTVALGALLAWYIWDIVYWALITAVWTGTDRQACLVEGGVSGACWPLVWDKFPQWIYGFYPVDERWRVNVVFILGIAGLVPVLIPSAPYKLLNAAFLILAYPLIALILLTGGHFNVTIPDAISVIALFFLLSSLLPLMAWGPEDGVARNRIGLALAGLGIVLWIVSLFLPRFSVSLFGQTTDVLSLLVRLCLLGCFVFSLLATLGAPNRTALAGWAISLAYVLVAMFLLGADFGLEFVETPQWGGLLVTLVVSVTGIAASLPLGILLALGRRSEMPVVKLFSIIFIELWRGVPLITVLFFSSVMLPLFLPEGTTFDKLLRALVGVAIFSAAYMAEVVRSGLQAIPKGQYEGAMAVGLSYWQMMYNVILPQALKISIPNIVGNFISLFKDTTLVSIIGLFDLLGIVRAGLKDANWAAPSTTPTGYFALAVMYWVFCFGMSRYSIFTERRLHTGHKR